MMATITRGILYPKAEMADKAGRGALPLVETQAERVVRVAMAQTATAHREQAMEEEVVEVEQAGGQEQVARAVREAMAKTAGA
jgi:hypothetical protein